MSRVKLPVGTESPRSASTAAWDMPVVVPHNATETQNIMYFVSVFRPKSCAGCCGICTHMTMAAMAPAGGNGSPYYTVVFLYTAHKDRTKHAGYSSGLQNKTGFVFGEA